MKEVVEAVHSRVKSPYFGYSILAFFALNWRGLFLLIVTNGDPQDRLAAFDAETSAYSLVLFPLLIGAAVAASTHWLRYFFGFISQWPLEKLANIDLEAEHRKTIYQTKLEQSRVDLVEVKEKELIARAKRDEEVAEIEDDDAKEKLMAQLESLRKERDNLSQQIIEQHSLESLSKDSISTAANELLVAASKEEAGTIIRSRSAGHNAIEAGLHSFGGQSQREFSKYDAALDELLIGGFIKESGSKGDFFELTHTGWQVATECENNNNHKTGLRP